MSLTFDLKYLLDWPYSLRTANWYILTKILEIQGFLKSFKHEEERVDDNMK